MKVAYLTGEYPRATDTFIQREVEGLRSCGIDVTTASVRRTGPEHIVGKEQQAEQARTFHILEAARNPIRLLADHLKLFTQSPSRWLRALVLSWNTAPLGLKGRLYNLIYFSEAGVLARHIQREGAAHLHNHIAKSSCTVAMLASSLAGVPYSFTLHGPDIFFEPIHWRLDEKIKRARFIACISHFCRAQAMSFSTERDWEKLHIIHCGVEPERYQQVERKPKGKSLLFIGRLAAVKGLPILFEAMAKLNNPSLHLDIVGDGPDRETLERRAREKGLDAQVTFHGYRSQSQVAEHIAECDALVLPSFAEGVPVVLMEAMAATRPVVTSRIAGIPELVEDGVSGVLCPPGDHLALAEGLCVALENGTSMGQVGRQHVLEEFDARTEAARLANLFETYAQGGTLPTRPEPKVKP